MKFFLLKSNFRRNVLTLMTGTTIAQAITIAISPILTRIYTPDDFGLFALYTSIVSVFSVVATGRYELAIMLPKKDSDALNIIILSVFFSFLFSLITLFIVILFNEEITNLLHSKEVIHWLYLIPVSVLLSGIYQSFNYWINRKNHYKSLAASRITQSSTTAIVSLGMGFRGADSNILVIGSILGQVASLIVLSKIIWNENKKNISVIKILKILALAKRYINFPKYDVWSGLFNTLSSQIPIFLLSIFFNSTIIGFYSLSHRILTIPMSLIGNAIGQVFFQESSRSIKNKEALHELTKTTFTKLFIIGFFPMLSIGVFGDLLFIMVFGENWVTAGKYAQILSIWIFLIFIVSPLSTLLISLEKQREALIFNSLMLISRAIALVAGYYIFHNAMGTIALYTLVSTVFWIGLMLYIFKQTNILLKEVHLLFIVATVITIITFFIKHELIMK